MDRELHVPPLEKYLSIIIFPFMGLGLVIGNYFPGFAQTLPTYLPICLFLMIYPTMLNVRLDELKDAFTDFKKVGSITVFNFILSPLLLAFLSFIFLRNQPELFMGLLILSIPPCIALVLVWTFLSDGNLALAVTLAAVNSIVQLILIPIYLPFLGGIFGLRGQLEAEAILAFGPIAREVLIYLALPFTCALLTRYFLEPKKGREWFEDVFVPKVGNIAPIGVLITITVMFSVGGSHVLENPWLLLLTAVPLIIFFPLNWLIGMFFTSKVLGHDYADSVAAAFSFSGRNIEVAMALSATLFGAGSLTAMATVVGPIVGIPAWIVMLNVAQRVYMPRSSRTEKSTSIKS